MPRASKGFIGRAFDGKLARSLVPILLLTHSCILEFYIQSAKETTPPLSDFNIKINVFFCWHLLSKSAWKLLGN